MIFSSPKPFTNIGFDDKKYCDCFDLSLSSGAEVIAPFREDWEAESEHYYNTITTRYRHILDRALSDYSADILGSAVEKPRNYCQIDQQDSC
jgi:hypothetical protein